MITSPPVNLIFHAILVTQKILGVFPNHRQFPVDTDPLFETLLCGTPMPPEYKMFKKLPTQKKLLEVLDYSPETGELKHRSTGYVVGTRSKTNRYLHVCIEGVSYPLHRVAWTMVNGQIPEGFSIDHIDLDKKNNRISNLRLADRYQQGYNTAPRKNATGFKGVLFDKTRSGSKPYKARIRVNKHRLVLGWFHTAKEAAAAYAKAAELYHGPFARYSEVPPVISSSA